MPNEKTTPATEVTANELARAVGVSRDTVYRWIERGLLAPVSFRGGSTRYGASHQLRARVIAKLRAEGVSLDAIARQLAVTDAELIARHEPPPPSTPAPSTPAAPWAGAPSWLRVELLPGLELHVAATASALVQRLAAEVVERYRATVTD